MPLLVIAWLDQVIQAFRSPSIKSFLDSGVRRNDDKIRYFTTVPQGLSVLALAFS